MMKGFFKNISLLTRLNLTYVVFLLAFTGLSLFIIHQMKELSRLTELTYRHPLAVSNAVLRIQGNVGKIRLLMTEVNGRDQESLDSIMNRMAVLDNEIEKDFDLINRRFLGDMRRFHNAYQEYKLWQNHREKSLIQYSETADSRGFQTSTDIQAEFTGEMEYLVKFAHNKAGEFLQSSRNKRDRSITLSYTLVLTFLGGGLLLVFNLMGSIKNPLDTLMHGVKMIRMGNLDRSVVIHSGGREFNQLAEAFNQMTGELKELYTGLEQKVAHRTEELQKAVEDRNTLIRELYHRTKNNMQVISSIISLQADEYPESNISAVMTDLENKIQSMALVHQMLYRSDDLSHIYLDSYIEELLRLILRTFNKEGVDIATDLDLQHIPILLDFAVPCGLILNELITNSVKYAFPENRKGTIAVAVLKESNVIHLNYRDNGVGLPEGFEIETSQSLGFILIKTITEHQLNGSMSFAGENGVDCTISFNDNYYRKRL